jgi:hypothetical protein
MDLTIVETSGTHSQLVDECVMEPSERSRLAQERRSHPD